MLPALSLAQRELVRFLRQRNRVIGALLTPLVFWLLIGGGMGSSFKAPGTESGYTEYFFPGTVLMIVLFTAIFSTISIIEDRREGFLQGVLVAPVSRGQIVLGKVLGGTVLAAGQAGLFLLLGPFVGVHFTLASVAVLAGVLILLSFALTAAGVIIAWRMTSTQGFHVVMNLLLMPLWFLSGALFPIRADTFGGLKWAMLLNPLTYGLAALRRAMHWGDGGFGPLPGLATAVGITLVFAAVMYALAWFVASRPERVGA